MLCKNHETNLVSLVVNCCFYVQYVLYEKNSPAAPYLGLGFGLYYTTAYYVSYLTSLL